MSSPGLGGPGGYGPPGWGYGAVVQQPRRRSRAPWFVAVGLVVVVAAGAALWLTVFKDKDNGGGSGGSQQDVARSYIEASKAHDVEAVKKVSCKADLDKISTNPGDALIPASISVESYKITGQHDVGGGPDASGGATVVDGSITLKDGPNSVTNPIDLLIVKEDGAFKACTSLARLSDTR